MLTIVFDLDGTLIDTAPDLISTLNIILGREGLPPVEYDSARRMIGGGAKAMIERALAAEGRASSKAELDRLFAAFIDHYAAHIADHSRPFPELGATLEHLAGEGHRLAVCTNKPEPLARLLLERLGEARQFSAICGRETFTMSKPDGRALRSTIALAKGDPNRALMVGDSKTDIDTARNAGAPIVAVDFGYSDPPIARLSPDRVISHFDELWDAAGALLG